MAGGDDDPVSLLPALHDALREAGRPAEGFEVTIYFCPPDADTVARCADGGISRVLLPMPSAARDAALARLDELAALIGR